MPGGKDKILGPQGTGTVDDKGVLTRSARNRFGLEVIALLNTGNVDGLGLSKINPLLPLPIPPIPGPLVPSISTGKTPLFWFDAQPFANLSIPAILNPDGAYQKLILDGLYAPLVGALNLDGNTPAAPVFDPTIFIDLKKFPNIELPDIPNILAELTVLISLSQIPPGIGAKLILFEDFGISDLQIPEILKLVLGTLSIPNIVPKIPEIPIPSVPNPGIPNFIIDDLALGIFKIPALVIPQIIGEVSIDFDPLAIIKKIIKIIIDLLLKVLEPIILLIAGIQLLAALS